MNDLRAAEVALLGALADELGCDSALFREPGLHFTATPRDPAATKRGRNFEWLREGVRIIALGPTAVVGATAAYRDLAADVFEGAGADDVFDLGRLADLRAGLGDALTLAMPTPFLVCGADTRVAAAPPGGVEIEIDGTPGARVAEFGDGDWPNAVAPERESSRPLAALAIARAGDTVVGLAGMNRDSRTLWQAGIDVAPAWKGRGLGAALASAVTGHTLERGLAPYWGAAAANIPSIRTAQHAGYRLAFLEAFTYREE